MLCGIDEAGRGPVLGPMVMSGILIHKKKVAALKTLGIKDSKLLSKKKRERFYHEILDICDNHKTIVIEPHIIDEHLRSSASSLNKLEAIYTADILNFLSPISAIIDLPDRNEEKYRAYIVNRLVKDIDLSLEYKADLNHIVVAAASILAKVTRDNIIEEIKEEIGYDFGSGYMTDPKTSRFLQKHWNDDDISCFRKEWASWKRLKEKAEQSSIMDF